MVVAVARQRQHQRTDTTPNAHPRFQEKCVRLGCLWWYDISYLEVSLSSVPPPWYLHRANAHRGQHSTRHGTIPMPPSSTQMLCRLPEYLVAGNVDKRPRRRRRESQRKSGAELICGRVPPTQSRQRKMKTMTHGRDQSRSCSS